MTEKHTQQDPWVKLGEHWVRRSAIEALLSNSTGTDVVTSGVTFSLSQPIDSVYTRIRGCDKAMPDGAREP